MTKAATGVVAVRRFVNDDPGYVAWLAAHPQGWVLNTYPHVSRDYLVLHRAACRTVNRALPSGRLWTHQYGKSCADDRAELEAWAEERTGGYVKPCGICLSTEHAPASVGQRITVEPRSEAPRGPRAARGSDVPIAHEGTPIRVIVRGPGLGTHDAGPGFAIEGAQWLAEFFFRNDPSAVGARSYDTWIAATQVDPHRRNAIVDDDVFAVNRTMASHARHAAWGEVIELGDWSWLRAIDPDWDLLELDDSIWKDEHVGARLEAAFVATRRPYLGLAVITKVLHIKRPRLVPVMDSLVVDQIGGRVTDDVRSWVAAIERLRAVGRVNLEPLRSIRTHLQRRGIADRSLIRILDALLWTGSPGAGLYRSLDGWEQVLRPQQQTQTG